MKPGGQSTRAVEVTTIGIKLNLALLVLAVRVLAVATFSVATAQATGSSHLSAVQRVALFDKLVDDIVRLDGDGLTIRHTRPESWKETISRLREAAGTATSPVDYGHVLYRLRATYPNMHASITLAEAFTPTWMPNGAVLPITLRAESLKPDAPRPAIRVATVNERWAKAQPTSLKFPQIGDVVISLNERPVAEWLRENEIFCRYPLAGQCPIEFQRNLARGLLFWNPDTPLRLLLLRNNETIRITLTAMSDKAVPNQPPTAAASPAKNTKDLACTSGRSRVPDGYTLTWAGTMVCVFENPAQPETQIWRIESFAAEQSRSKDAAPGQFKSVEQEVNAFCDEFWKSKSANVKHLIIDVAGNSGGESVVRWHQLFFQKPFQMPFVQYKKIREFDQPKVRKALFWGSSESQQFIDVLKREGSFAKIADGDWLPPQQMFCPGKRDTCNNEFHQPLAHSFAGRVSIVVDQFCNSACVSFVWNARDKIGARIVGLPDTGDTTFSRPEIHFGLAADGAIVTSLEDASVIAQPIGRFTVAATRSTDAKGSAISAKPLLPDVVVPRAWHQSGDEWGRQAIDAALLAH